MKVKIFDESHEQDLEEVVNDFIKTIRVIDIKYQVSTMYDQKTQEQIYCYSALIMYNKKANQK